jgi:hypothetical protein
MVEEDPSWHPNGSGKMSNGGVGCDHKFAVPHELSGMREGGQCRALDVVIIQKLLLLGGDLLLKADEIFSWDVEDLF